MSEPVHYVVIVPGLGDDVALMKFGTAHFRFHGFIPLIFSIGWRDKDPDFQPRLNELLKKIDLLVSQGYKVSLLGCSAGCSAVMNAFNVRRNIIEKVICVCGRLRTGPETGFRSFSSATSTSPRFARSIKMCEASESTLSPEDRKKVLTFHALLGDQLVPPETAILDGATNLTVPSGEHVTSIALALTLFSRPIFNFLSGSAHLSYIPHSI